eukprot:14070-Heterococcus_DN1.PRE.2
MKPAAMSTIDHSATPNCVATRPAIAAARPQAPSAAMQLMNHSRCSKNSSRPRCRGMSAVRRGSLASAFRNSLAATLPCARASSCGVHIG